MVPNKGAKWRRYRVSRRVVGHAGSGYYAATKFVVEGLSEALAQEVVTIRGFESVKLCEDAVQRR